MNKLGIVSTVLAICALLLASYLLVEKDKIGYIENVKVFDKFEYKKELESKLKAEFSERKNRVDSLYLDLKKAIAVYEKTGNAQDLRLKKEVFEMVNQELEEEQAEASSKYDAQIWTQINQYVKEYGETHGYDYIMGANGSGSLMYCKESENITDEVIAFINKKHKGK